MAAMPQTSTWGYYSFPEADAPFCFAAEQVCEADMSGGGDDWPLHLEFSPDGLSVLAQGSDRSTRVWSIPQTSFVHHSRPESPEGLGEPVCSVSGKDATYPAAWHPSSACFALPSKQQPVALFSASACASSAGDGAKPLNPGAKAVAVYVPSTDGDALDDVRCVAFLCGGARLLGAGPGGVHVFDVARPGRSIVRRPLVSRRRGRSGGVAPLSIAASQDGSGLYACGSQDCTVGLFDHRSGDLVATLAGHRGGVNHVAFSPDSRLLATSARRDDAVLVWDLRRPPPQPIDTAGTSSSVSGGRSCSRARASDASAIGVMLRLGRPAGTHQRTSFSFDSSTSLLLAGTTEAFTLAFELASGSEVLRLPSPDGLPAPLAQFHPRGIVMATGSGARTEPGAKAWWNVEDSDEPSSDASSSSAACPASVRMYRSAFRWAA